jgi:DNA-binding NtrC family response regulator
MMRPNESATTRRKLWRLECKPSRCGGLKSKIFLEKKMATVENPKPTRVRVLLIDDELGYVNVLSNRLSKRGFIVGKASGGTEAFQVLRQHDFDVAILDLKMVDMDGLEVLKILRKMAPEMVVIMLTGHGSAQAAHEGIRQGAYDYLTKPCELNELMEKIMEAYRQRPVQP